MNEESSTNTVPGLIQNKVFKIIVLGDSAVGKTCLTYRFCEGRFLEKAEATIGVDFRERSVKIFNEDVKLQLWDTAGQERFRKSMVHHYYRNVHAIVIVYDVTKPDTFQSVNNWMEEVLYHGLESAPRVLVGNKCDSIDYKCRVPTLLAQRIADKYEMPLFETSARLDSECDNVESMFMTLAHKLYTKQPFKAIRLQEENKDPNSITLTKRRSGGASGNAYNGVKRDGCICN